MDGHDDWIDTGFTPAAGVQFQQSSAMLGIWARKADRNAVAPVGTVTGTSVSLNPRGATDANAGRLNGTAVTSGGSVASGYGFTAIDRPGAAVVRQFIGGVQKGENGNAPAAARSTARVGIGRANGVAADGQYCAFVAGGSLSAAQHGVLHDALQGYMDALGVMPLPVAVATARSAAAWTSLPDGSAPIVAGRGMAVTGLTRDLAGRWYVGNGRTTRHPLLFSRMSPDLAAIEAEFDLTRLGLSVDMAGSCQGMTLDRSDGSLWIVVKLSGASGSDSHLLHFDPATDTMAAPPVLLSAGTNGVAWDPHADCLWMLRDSSELVACDRSGAILSASTPVPANSDQCMIAATASGDVMPGELLVTSGLNGASGTIHRYRRLDYGGWVLTAIDTMSGADAIEGVWIDHTGIRVGNDAATHSGSPPLNRIGHYHAGAHA